MSLKQNNQTTKQPNNKTKSFQFSVFSFQCRHRRCGFTLIELLVVISIIGILIGLSAVSFTTAQKKSRDAKRKADMKEIQVALEQCYSLQAGYPTSTWDASNPTLTCGTETIASVFPQDPKNADTYTYQYNYYNPDGSEYCICALLEQDTGNISDLPAAGSYSCSFGTSAGDQYFCVQNLQ